MLFDAILSKQKNKYIARVKECPEVTVEEESREGALQRIKARLLEYLTKQVEVVQIEIPLPTNPENPFPVNVMAFLEKVEAGEHITITVQGHEVACLVPCEDRMEKTRRALQRFRKNAVVGDIVSPLEETWEALQ
jgi:prevent-host-death family protein